jgi:hypothetical protein
MPSNDGVALNPQIDLIRQEQECVVGTESVGQRARTTTDKQTETAVNTNKRNTETTSSKKHNQSMGRVRK